MTDKFARRPSVVPARQPLAPLAIFLGGVLSLSALSTILAGVAWVALWVAGETDLFAFRQLLGMAIVLVSVRVVDLAIRNVRE